jgi:hypothetical protein
VEDVDAAVRGRVGARVVEHDLENAGVREEPVVLLAMDDPATQLAGPDRHVVDVDDRIVREAPPRVVDLGQRAALIGVRGRPADGDTVDLLLERVTVGRNRGDVLLRLLDAVDAR